MPKDRHGPLVTVATFASGLDASVARGALEAEGIRAYVPGEPATSLSRSRVPAPITEVRVRSSDRRRAMEVLERAASR
jgi:hypothetical protein